MRWKRENTEVERRVIMKVLVDWAWSELPRLGPSPLRGCD